MTTVRTVMAITVSKGWSLHQMDVKNAFSHGDLKKEIFMSPPSGLFPSSSVKVCRLKRSLYGLKQAPQAWFENFVLLYWISLLLRVSMTHLSSFARLTLGSL